MDKFLRTMCALVVMGLFSVTAFAQQPLDKMDAFYLYLKNKNVKLTDQHYEDYAHYIESDVWNKYRNDEFEWADQFAQCKKRFDEKIASATPAESYLVATGVEFGDYDFEKGGYKVSLSKDIFFPLGRASVLSNLPEFKKTIALKPCGLEKYNLLPMEKDAAKSFLNARKDSYYGSIDREIMIAIYYTIDDFNSKQYKDFEAVIAKSRYLPITGTIQKIEVYDSKGTTKIGELAIK